MPVSTFTLRHYLGEAALNMTLEDMGFLLRQIRGSDGEFDLQLRNGYFNIYYQGNSLAKVTPKPRTKSYVFEVNKAFGLGKIIGKLKHEHLSEHHIFQKPKEYYEVANVPASLVHPFFQSKVVTELQSRIRKHGYGQEITFEQSLITDNLNRWDFLIIDRQIVIQGQPGKMDLLALRLQPSGKYSFVVIEVKLGNNKELSGPVARQLDTYVNLVRTHLSEFKKSYEENYRQKRLLGVLGGSKWRDRIEIEDTNDSVEGRIVVGFYSGTGQKRLDNLLAKHKDLGGHIDCCWHRLP